MPSIAKEGRLPIVIWIKKILRSYVLPVSVPVIILFGLAEIGARMYEYVSPPMPFDVGQGFDKSSLLFVPIDNGYMETHPDKRISFRYQRFLQKKPPRTLRIFALGESSVNYLEYEFSELEKELQRQFGEYVDRVEIINCGGLSYGSHRLVLVALEIVHYEPDLILIYMGHNEFEEVQQMHLAISSFVVAQRTLGHLALFRRMRDFLAQRRIASLEEAQQIREVATSIPDSSKAWLHEFTQEEIEGRMAAFESNLTAMVTLFQRHNIPVILGTVPSNLFQPNLPGPQGHAYEEVRLLFASGAYAEGIERGRAILRNASPRHQSSDSENEIIRRVADTYRVPLADVEAAIIAAEPHGVPGETLFNDHCHLNPAGNRILRECYQSLIVEILRTRLRA